MNFNVECLQEGAALEIIWENGNDWIVSTITSIQRKNDGKVSMEVLYEDESLKFIEEIGWINWKFYGGSVKSNNYIPFENDDISNFQKYLKLSQDLKKFPNSHSRSILRRKETM